MKVKVRKILLCVFFALFIVTLFTASFSLGRYSSVQSSESDYDDDFEYTLYDSIVVNTIDEFFAAISNGYNYIIIGDAIKDPLIIAGSMSDIRDDLIIDLNGHEIQRNSRDPLLNVTTGFTLTIIDRVGTGSMYNPVGSVIQVSGGTLTVQNGIFESGPRSDNSRDAKRHNDVNVNDYNEYVKDTPDDDELYSTPGGGSISATNGTREVTVYSNSYIGETDNSSGTYIKLADNVSMPIITPKTVIRYPDAEDDNKTVISGSMYFDTNSSVSYSVNGTEIIKEDTYLYYTYEAENMQFSNTADKSTANYYYQYEDENLDTITVYVYNDVKKYANNGYYPVDSSSDNTGFAAVKMQEGNLYVRGGTYYSYFGEKNTYCVESTGGLMSVSPTGTNAINFYAYQNGVCVDCSTSSSNTNTPVNEMLNISSGKFYSELGDTVRVKNGNLVIGTADFTKDVSSSDIESEITTDNLQNLTDEKLAKLYSYNNSVVNISGGTLNINTRATFNVYGSGVTGIRASSQAASSKATVNTNNATFNFYGAGNSKLDASFTRGVYTDGGSVTFDGTTNINLAQISVDGQSLTSRYNVGVLAGSGGSVKLNGNTDIVINGNDNPSGGNYGIYSTGGGITCGQDSNSSTTIKIAENSASTGNYGIYSGGGSITTYGTTEITLGNTANLSTSNYGIYSSGGTVTLGNEGTGSAIIKILGSSDNSSTRNNYAAYLVGGGIELNGAEAEMEVYGAHSAGIYTSQAEGGTATTININNQFKCSIVNIGTTLSSAAIIANGGTIGFNLDNSIAEQGYGITSTDLGIVAKSGANVNFTSGSLSLTSIRGTSIYVEGGNITIGSEQNNSPLLDVTCQLGQNLHGGDAVTWDGSISTTANRYNAIFVSGGSLISNGTLNVKHVGVANDIYGLTATTAFIDHQIKSYAVRVEGTTGTDDNGNTTYSSTVTISSGTITNDIGGGVYVGGGGVTLANATVEADGVGDYLTYEQGNHAWTYYASDNGGHAIEVNDGNLTVNRGTYTSNQGNGILVRNGDVTINNGTFSGKDVALSAGAAASYAFKLYGGELDITGGEFVGSGGGAFVMGDGSSQDSQAKVTMTGGTINVSGSTGFAIWTNAEVTFGEQGSTAGPTITAESTGLTIEQTSNTTDELYNTDRVVKIYGGTFRSYTGNEPTKNGIWCGSSAFDLEIYGGTFVGTYGYGLQNSGVTNNVQIYAGTFYSRPDNRYSPVTNATNSSGQNYSRSYNQTYSFTNYSGITILYRNYRCYTYTRANNL